MDFNYKSKRWKRLSAAAMRRDRYMCQLSKRYGKSVPAEVVHHIYPADEYPEYAYCLWNLISLSRKKHNTLHDRENDTLTAEGIALKLRTKRPESGHPPTLENKGLGVGNGKGRAFQL